MSQQINLISPLLLKKRYAFGLREMALGLGLTLAVALAWAGYLTYRADRLEKEAAQQEGRQAAAQQELDRLSAAATRPVSALLTERVKAAQARVAQREALLASMRSIIESTSAGFSPRLRALAQSSTEGVWLNGFTLSPDYVALKGSALNAGLVTTYMDRLGKQAPFAGMKFSGMEAVLAQPAGDGQAQPAGLPEHIDFALYSGSPKNPADKGGSDGR
ncbi:MAG: PilN domain-containing protein [Hydrogenophilales bacterium]|nr:PilN domain-containing protein [Hydrogenophilales bacterium]